MKKAKVILVYKEDEIIHQENVWAEKIGEYYRVKNIPFFAPNIALDDLIKVEDDNGILYFDELIEASGNSVVQITFFDMTKFESVTKELERLGCSWEGSHIPSYISINIPKEIDYNIVKSFLDKLFNQKIIDYKEACLGFM